MDNECLICKKHYTQSGKCMLNKSNCLLFEEEPRGKKVRTKLAFDIDPDAETHLIKPFSVIRLEEGGKTEEITVIKILYIDLEKWIIAIEGEFYQNETPVFQKKRTFKIVK